MQKFSTNSEIFHIKIWQNRLYILSLHSKQEAMGFTSRIILMDTPILLIAL